MHCPQLHRTHDLPRLGLILTAAFALPAVVFAAEPPDREPPPAGMTVAPCGGKVAAMQCIPGGWFTRGHDKAWKKDARPAARVWQGTFFMDTYEVTSGDYRDCWRAKGCKHAKPLYGDFSRSKQPMVGMSWFDAVDYCRWRGKHLPSEAEWEKAARGPDGETHPWGDQAATCERAVIMNKAGKRSCGTAKRGTHPEVGRTYVVGTRPVGRYGLYDMAGNAWEWVADWYSKSWTACGDACSKPNPRGPCDGAARCKGHRMKLVKGGSWYWPAKFATSYYRRAHPPANQPISHFGFRCAASLAEAVKIRAGQTPAALRPPPPEKVRGKKQKRKRKTRPTRRK